MTVRTLEVDGLVNARDLGGLPLTGGSVTPSGVFYRSETVEQITATGWDQLWDAGVRTIVDLRHQGERDADVQRRPDWLTTLTADLDGPENREFWTYYEDNDLDGTAMYFLPHLEAMPERMASVLTALADAPEGGVLFHCMGGRDRTGMTAMVLLSLVGVEPEAIVADYLETVSPSDGRPVTEGKRNYEALLEQLLNGFGTTTEKAFRDALDGFELAGFLQRAGLSPRVRETLQTWRGHLPANAEQR